MTTLHTLHVDVLAVITSWLSAEDVVYLWFTGDLLLCVRLALGGVNSLQIFDPLVFARLVASCASNPSKWPSPETSMMLCQVLCQVSSLGFLEKPRMDGCDVACHDGGTFTEDWGLERREGVL